jgi:drug/metabolite transporter (DMT)-like permease
MKARIWTALIAVYICWGSTYLAIRFAVETMPPFLMAGTRFLIAGAILFTWRRLAGDGRPSKVEWRSAAIVGAFLLLLSNGTVVWAEQRVASGITALLVSTAPLWMVLIDALRPGGQRPGWQTVTGVLVGFSGILLLVGPQELAGNSQSINPLGLAALLLAPIFWSIGSLYNRGAKLPASPLLGTGMEMLAGGAGLLALGTLTGEWSRLHLSAITPRSWWSLAYLVVFGALVGFAAYTWLLRVAPTPLVSTYAYVNPLIAVFLGSLLAQEPLNARILLSAGVIIGAVVLINTSRMAGPQAAEIVPTTTTGND